MLKKIWDTVTGRRVLEGLRVDLKEEALSWDLVGHFPSISAFTTSRLIGGVLPLLTFTLSAPFIEKPSDLFMALKMTMEATPAGFFAGGWTYTAYMKSRDSKLKDQKPSVPEPQ